MNSPEEKEEGCCRSGKRRSQYGYVRDEKNFIIHEAQPVGLVEAYDHSIEVPDIRKLSGTYCSGLEETPEPCVTLHEKLRNKTLEELQMLAGVVAGRQTNEIDELVKVVEDMRDSALNQVKRCDKVLAAVKRIRQFVVLD